VLPAGFVVVGVELEAAVPFAPPVAVAVAKVPDADADTNGVQSVRFNRSLWPGQLDAMLTRTDECSETHEDSALVHELQLASSDEGTEYDALQNR